MVRSISTNATFISATSSPYRPSLAGDHEAGFILPETIFNEINAVATFVSNYMPVPTIDFTLLKIAAQPDLSHVPEDILSQFQDIIPESPAPVGCYIFIKDCTVSFPQLTDQQEYNITLTLNYELGTPVNGWGVYLQSLKCQLTNIAQIV